jgi:WD repeat-containing protein 44
MTFRITSVSFDADGDMVVAGIAKGQVVFFTYNEDGLRYNTKLECKNRRGQYHLGTNITGLSFFRDSNRDSNELLVSCNDSRIRLVNLDDFSVYSKLKGVQNTSMPIKATFSEDGKYVISGSDTGFVGIWCRHNPAEKSIKVCFLTIGVL